MSKDRQQKYSLADLAGMLGYSMQVAQMLGRAALCTQILEERGGEVLGPVVSRCDDCQNSDRYTGDDEADLDRLLEEE